MKISEKGMKIIYIINIIFIVALIILWQVGDIVYAKDQWVETYVIQSIIMISAVGLGAGVFLYLGFLYKLSTVTGKIWFLIGLGLLCWCIGDIIYSYLELTEQEYFPSIADFLYLIAYIPLSIGLLLQLRLIEIELPERDKLIVLISYLIICIIVIYTVIIIPIQDWYEWDVPEEDYFELTITFLYPILDLLLIFCALVVFTKLRHGKINTAWILLLIGLLVTAVADILYNWVEGVIGGTEKMFENYDLLFLIGYIFIYISAFSLISIMSKVFDKSET